MLLEKESEVRSRCSLSVVVPVFNSGRTIESCLKAIKTQLRESDELVVVDDGSGDGSVEIAKKYTTKVVVNRKNMGLVGVRRVGVKTARGDVVVFVDSDGVVPNKALERVRTRFFADRKLVALTGRLSKETRVSGFASEYKNLYMNYVFSLLPKEVNFVYGSFFAVRRKSYPSKLASGYWGEDTALGQQITSGGGKIEFDKELEVVHLKKYSIWSLLQNDFMISSGWAGIFWRNRGWRQLGRKGVGFAHASKRQLVSLGVVSGFWLLAIGYWLVGYRFVGVGWWLVLVGVWVGLNGDFLIFLVREKGWWFGVRGMMFTWFDQTIMLSGVGLGSIWWLISR